MPVKETPAKEEKPRQDKSYNPQIIGKKWQANGKWTVVSLGDRQGQTEALRVDHAALSQRDLHIGHWYAMTPNARARYMRMRGYNVLFPMGFDAFTARGECRDQRRRPSMKRTFQNIERMRSR